MKKFILLIFISFSTTLLFGQKSGTLSDAQVSFTFVSKKVEGTIAGFKSKSIIDKNNIANSEIKGSMQTKTLDSGNFLRNWSLKGSKYFDVDTYPVITFKGTSIEKHETGFEVSGQLTIKDTSKPIKISFKEEGGRLKGSTILYSSDFGIQVIKKSREANEVVVQMSFKVN